MTRHVSTENLARFRSGDLSAARSRRVEAHLRNCARCRETSDALAGVPSLLASVPVPQMPAHLAARIETALAAESAHRAAGVPERSERPARTARARRGHRRPVMSGPRLRVLAAAGAAVVLVGGVVGLLTHSSGSSTTSGTASSASGGSSHASSSGSVPRATNGSPMYGALRYSSDGHTAYIKPVQTGTDYRAGRLTQQVGAVLAGSRPRLHTAGPDIAPNTFGPLGTLGGCVSRVAAGRHVLLVDVARFDRKPATVIVTARQGASAAQVWVVGAGCSAKTSDVLAHRSLPAH